MEIYFDNAATTRIDERVLEFMDQVQREHYGNPSALHRKGLDAEHCVKDADRIFTGILKCTASEIIYTSGGTESNNLALIGGALANRRRGMHIITSSLEHGSVSMPLKALEDMGFSVTRIGTDGNGVIDLKALEEAIRNDTIIVSVMAVNNEIGTIEPLGEIGKIIKKKDPKILFHVDAIQAFTKFPIIPPALSIDMMSASSHKFYGPKGMGFLYVKKGVRIDPLMLGGGQQRGMRSGTVNVPGIAAMAMAAELSMKEMEERTALYTELRERIITGIKDIEGVYVNAGSCGTPAILSITAEDVGAEVLLHALEDREIYVSSGSACSSHGKKESATLTSIGLSQKAIKSTVRLSFGKYNTPEEADRFVEAFRELVPVLRKYTRK
ncbi:MAG: cysteine desulfurase [Lachnospiraceae bacterium]|nr:cysteine desulfurase [Lachnospiraceae bacterium]